MGWLGDLTRKALQANATMEHGMAHGLTEDEAKEVLSAWIEHNLTTGASWSPDVVRRSMDQRADGQDWKPRA